MHRWRKPPIFAFAYISPARSSKRRITSIVSRTVRQVSLSGRSCLTFPNPISSRPATSLGDRPSLPGSSLPWVPSPACVTSLVAIGSESTHCRPRSITLTPVWGALLRRPGGSFASRSLTPRATRVATLAPSHAAKPTPTPAAMRSRRSSVRCLDPARRHTHGKLRRGQGGSRVFEAVVAPEQLVPDGDRGNAANAALVGLLGGLAEAILHGLSLDRPQHGVRVELAGGGRDEHVVHVREILATGERLAKGGEGERNRATDRSGEGGGAHGLERVGGPLVGPADGHELVLSSSPFDLRHAGLALIGYGPRACTRLLPDAAEKDRLPDRHYRKDLMNALGGEVGVRRSEVVIEDRLLDHGALVARQSDAAEGVLHGQVDALVVHGAAFTEDDGLQLVERIHPIVRVAVDVRGPLALGAKRTVTPSERI